jgi:2',3'-cyclic-nucleotide 2'-phosphodiesterase / 3'-nucleotidase
MHSVNFALICYNGRMSQNTTLCVTSDVHATVFEHAYADGQIKPYGLSRYLTALAQRRDQGPLITLDNGDILQGSPLLTYFHQKHRSPHLLAQVLNHLGIDYFNLGNHDFNYGLPILKQFLSDLNAKLLTSNVLLNGQPLGESCLHLTSDGTRIAFIGVVTDYIPHWEKPQHLSGITFLDPIDVVKNEVAHWRSQVDLVIVAYHGGLERDPATGEPTEPLTGENDGYALAQIPGIDLLITGHQHRSIATRIGSTFVTQTAFNALEFAEIKLNGSVIQSANLIKLGEVEPDPSLATLVEPWERHTQTWLDQPVGRLHGHDYRIRDKFDARIHKHPLISFINDIQRELTGAELSGTSLFNEPVGFNPIVTTRDIVSTYIYPNTLVVKRITGTTLKAYLEQCAEYFTIIDGTLAVNPAFDDPKPQHFNYDMVDGITYTLCISNPVGHRVTHLLYEGESVRDEQSFTLVINNYRAAGGGNFAMIADSETIAEINTDFVELLIQYFQAHPDLTPVHRSNITITL